MAFRVGQKVVCVDAAEPDLSKLRPAKIWRSIGLVQGAVYTVAAVGLTHSHDPDALPCIQIVELKADHAIWAHRFRPVVERKTDISIFTKMLTGKRVDA